MMRKTASALSPDRRPRAYAHQRGRRHPARARRRACSSTSTPAGASERRRRPRAPRRPRRSSSYGGSSSDEVERRRPGDRRARRAPRGTSCADDSIAVRDRRSARGSRAMSAGARRSRSTNVTARRAAAERLDAERAGARVAVEHARAGDARREDVEQRLAQLVRGRPQPRPRRRLQPAALQRSGDDAHRIGHRVDRVIGSPVSRPRTMPPDRDLTRSPDATATTRPRSA